MNLKEFRAQYPQYNDIDDATLADSLHKKYYADMPREQFMAQVGVGTHELPAVEGKTDSLGLAQGAAAVGDILGSIPGAFAGAAAVPFGAIAGLATGQDPIKMALESGRQTMEALTPSQMIRNAGELLGSKATTEAVDKFRQTPGYHEVVERPFGALVGGARDVGAVVAEGLNTLTGDTSNYERIQTGSDLGEIGLMLMPLTGIRGRRGLSKKQQQVIDEMLAKEQAEKAAAEQAARPPVEPQQLELPLESGFKAGEGPLPYEPTVAPLRDMRQNVQPDLFERDPSSFPGEQRIAAEQAAKERVPYELSLEEPTDLSSSRPMEPFRQGDLDFPLRQEAIDRDPYIKTLKEEADKAFAEYNRLQKWTKQFKKQPPSIINKMNEAVKRIDEVTGLAREYLTNAYRVSTPDQYTGSMWRDQPMQMEIQKTDRPTIGAQGPQLSRQNSIAKRIEKTPTYRLGRTKQEGAIDMEAIKGAIDDLTKRISSLEGNLDRLTPAAREQAEKRLARLYYEQMRHYHAMEALADPSHPHHQWVQDNWKPTGTLPPLPAQKGQPVRKGWTKDPKTGKWLKVESPRDPFKGPGKKQAGAINFAAMKDGPERFQAWIKDSIVKVPVYHATANRFARFAEGPYARQMGIHVGTRGQATQRSLGGHLMAFYAKMKNPLRLEDLGDWNPGAVAAALLRNKEFRGTFTRQRLERIIEEAFPKNAMQGAYSDSGPFSSYWKQRVDRQKDTYKLSKRADRLYNELWKIIESKGYDSIAYKNYGEIDPFLTKGDPEVGQVGSKPVPEQNVSYIVKNNDQLAVADKFFNETAAANIDQSYRPSIPNEFLPKENPHIRSFQTGKPLILPGKQEGAIFFGNKKRDPAFEQFKSKLPLPMRKDAKKLYKEYLKKQEEQGKSPIYENGQATETIDNIPALRDWKEEVAPIPADVPTIKERIMKDEDLSGDKMAKVGRQLVSGGKMLGFGTQNTLVRFTVQQMDNAIRGAQKLIHKLILDENTGFRSKWEKLKDEEFGELWSNLLINEGKMDLSPDALRRMGMNEKQVEAATVFRQSLDAVYDRLNEVRASMGKKPLEKRLGYIPSRFRGDWTVEVRDINGDLIHVIGAMTQRGAERIKAQFEEAHPNYNFSDVKHEPLHRFKDSSDANAGYQQLLEILDDGDPRVKALEDTYQEWLSRQAYEAMSIRKHFFDKKGVLGFEGGKVWLDAVENAKEGLRSTANYIDHALKWAEMQDAIKPLKELLKDKEIEARHPNAHEWSHKYIAQAMGRSTDMARAMDKLVDVFAEHTGIGQSAALKGIRELKDWMTSYYLGFWNLGFSISQFVQVIQTIPAWQHMFINKGAGGPFLITTSYAAGSMDTIKYFTRGLEKRMSDLSQKAMEHAEKYAVVEPHILDEVRTEFSRTIKKGEEWIRTKNMTMFEHQARTMAYLTWVHFLDQTGRFKPGRELFETAANLTDMTMVDYRGHERAMLYKQMGLFGEMSNALTTYKHNYFSQMWALNQHRKGVPNKQGQPTSVKAGLSPLGVMVGTGALLSGLLGLPGREDLDGLIRLINMASPERLPSTRELFLKAPDFISFGAVSALSGLDVSGKFSTANILPDSAAAFLQPFAASVGDMAGAVGSAVTNPSEASLWRMAHTLSPGGTKVFAEEYFTRKNKRGKDVFIDPKTMEGRTERSTFDKAARAFGLRSLEESKEAHTARNVKDQDMFLERRRSAVIERARDVLFAEEDPQKRAPRLMELGRKYVLEYEGNPRDFLSQMEGRLTAWETTALERELIKSVRNPLRGKRVLPQVK